MPTIQDIPTRRSDEPTPRHVLATAWPLLLLALLLVLVLLRVAGRDDGAGEERGEASGQRLVERRAGDVRIDLPRQWVTLERGASYVTFGEPDRMHTVTIGSTEASALALPGVVRAMLERTTDQLPGARPVEAPRSIDLGQRAARGDSAMLARFRVGSGGSGSLEITQVWRRDSRAGLDLVATWTSADGTWPVSPRDAMPSADEPA